MRLLAFTILMAATTMLLAEDAPPKTSAKAEVKAATRVFEMRTYYAAPGKMKELHARFRDHTIKLFEKHGMTHIGFWVPMDEKGEAEKLVYILSYPSKEAADKAWKGFREDPAWKKVREESEKNGKLVEKVESLYMNPIDFSPIK
jgi:hypothetical protein